VLTLAPVLLLARISEVNRLNNGHPEWIFAIAATLGLTQICEGVINQLGSHSRVGEVMDNTDETISRKSPFWIPTT
jgi:hypothetical protein